MGDMSTFTTSPTAFRILFNGLEEPLGKLVDRFDVCGFGEREAVELLDDLALRTWAAVHPEQPRDALRTLSAYGGYQFKSIGETGRDLYVTPEGCYVVTLPTRELDLFEAALRRQIDMFGYHWDNSGAYNYWEAAATLRSLGIATHAARKRLRAKGGDGSP